MKSDPSKEAVRLLGILLLCMIPFLLKLDVPDSTFHMEVMSLMSSQETWLRYHSGETEAWLVPSWNGRPRINKPPLVVWLNFLAWCDLDPVHDSVEALVFRARLLAVCLMGFVLLSTYMLGRLLGGIDLAWKAALATGTMLFFIRQGRLASYDTHLLAWVTLAVASGWWALRAWHTPSRTVPSLMAATGSGILLAAALLAKGPIAFLFAFVPLLVIARIDRPSGRSPLPLLFLSLVVALALSFPWYAYVLKKFPDSGLILFQEYRQRTERFQPPWYYLALLGLVFPWTVSLAGALTVPFFGRKSNAPREGWIPFVWLVSIVVVMSIPEAKKERYILSVLPAAGLLVAQWWQVSGDAGWRGVIPPRWREWVGNAHGGMLVLGSFGFALFPLVQTFLLQKGILHRLELPGAGWRTGLVLGGILIGLSIQAFRAIRRDRPDTAFGLTSVWMILLSSVVLNYYVHSDHGHYRGRIAAEKTAALSGGAELVYLGLDPGSDLEPDQKFLLYSRRVIPEITPSRLAEAARGPQRLWVIARARAEHERMMAEHGLRAVLSFHDGRQERVLYVNDQASGVEDKGP